jgi:hypothetical protein
LLRSLLFWAPVVVLWGVGIAFDQTYWSGWHDPEVRRADAWMPAMAWVAWGLSLAVLAAYFVRAIWKPQRSWHDRIVGTWLMPR